MTVKLSRVALSKDGTPKWNKLFTQGEYARRDMPGGKVTADTAAFRQMIDNWKKMGGNALPIDRFHWGTSSDKTVRADDKDAVGFIEDLRIDADGDLEGLTNWNAVGREKIENDKLRYFSPEFHPNAKDRHDGRAQGWTLFGGALLNDPFLSELPRLAASVQDAVEPVAPPFGDLGMKKLVGVLSSLLSVKFAADVSEDTLVDAVEKYSKERAADHDQREKLKKDLDAAVKLSRDSDSSKDTLTKALDLEVEERLKLSAKVEQLSKDLASAKVGGEADALVAKLRKERRILPAEVEDVKAIALSMGVEKATAIYSKRPQVGPIPGEIGRSPTAEDEVTGDELTPAQANEKLALAAKEIEKTGVKADEAFMMALEQNPKIALAAQPAPIRVAVVAA